MSPIANYNLGSVQGSIDIDYDGSGTAEARADVRKLARDLERDKLVAKIEADTKVLQRKRNEALALLETLVDREWTPEIQVEIDNARAQIAGFEQQLSRLDGQHIKIHLDIADELARTRVALDSAGEGTESLRGRLTRFGADVRDTRSAVESFGNTLTTIGKPAAALGALHLASSAVAQLTAAVAPAVGVVGLLPGVLGAAAVSMAVVKIGTAGMGDAMSAVAEGDAKKLAEAMAKLSPEAREVVTAYQAIKPALDSLKMNVQNALFRDMGDLIGALASTFLPTLDSGLSTVAGSLNRMMYLSAQALMQPATVNDLNEVLGGTAGMFDAMGNSLGMFLNGFMGWAAVAATYLPQFGSWIQQITNQFVNWTDRMVESGEAWNIIDRGLEVLKNLWVILTNIGSIVAGIFRPLAADAQGLLPTLVALTNQAREWVNSAEGQQNIANIWQFLSAISGALLTVLATLAPIIGAIAQWFASLPGPVQAVVAQFLAWSLVIGVVLSKMAPMIAFLVQIGPVLMRIGPALTMLVNGFMAVMRVFRALSLLMMTNPWLLLIAAVILLVYLIITNWDTIKAYLATAWNWISTTAMTIWNGIVNFFTTIWNWLVSLAISIFTGIVTFFLGIWNSISGTVMSVWNGIVSFFTFVTGIIVSIFQFFAGVLLAVFFTLFQPIYDLVIFIWNGIVAFLTMIWTGIVAQATALWNMLVVAWQVMWTVVSTVAMTIWNAIVSFLTGIWNGIKATASAVWNGILAVLTAVWNAIWGFIGPTVMRIVEAVSNAWNRVMSVTSSVFNSIKSTITSIWNGIVSFFTGVWNTISGIFQGAVGRVMGVLSGLWSQITSLAGSALNLLVNAGRNIVTGLWNGIVSMGAWLYNAIMGWVRSVVPGPVLQFLGIASPSRYMRDEVGKHIPTGIAAGIEAKSDVAADAARDLAKNTGDAAKKAAMDETVRGLADAGIAVAAQIGSLPASVQAHLGSLGIAAASNAAGSTPAASASATAAESSTTTSTRTIQVGTLTLEIKGNLDPTDSVRWRKAMEAIREGITNVEASYR